MSFSFPHSHLIAGNTAHPDCIMIVGRQREGRADSCSLAWSGDWRERTGLDGGFECRNISECSVD